MHFQCKNNFEHLLKIPFTTLVTKFKTTIAQDIRDYVIITIGLIMYAMGFTCFQLPYEITTGGLAGAAAVMAGCVAAGAAGLAGAAGTAGGSGGAGSDIGAGADGLLDSRPAASGGAQPA